MRFAPAALLILVVLAACAPNQGSSTASPQASESAPTADGAVTVTAVDYAFSGIPDEVAAGTEFSLVNEGAEAHELVLIRRNDGVTESFEELLALPEEDAMEFAAVIGAVFADPGAESGDTLTAAEPGDYLAVCFVPVGTTSAEASMDMENMGPPHFVEGMLLEFTVTE